MLGFWFIQTEEMTYWVRAGNDFLLLIWTKTLVLFSISNFCFLDVWCSLVVDYLWRGCFALHWKYILWISRFSHIFHFREYERCWCLRLEENNGTFSSAPIYFISFKIQFYFVLKWQPVHWCFFNHNIITHMYHIFIIWNVLITSKAFRILTHNHQHTINNQSIKKFETFLHIKTTHISDRSGFK